MNSIHPIITLDIETIPDQTPGAVERIAATIMAPKTLKKIESIAEWEANERPAAIESAWRKTALNGGRGQVAVLSWCVDDEPVRAEFSEDWRFAEASVLSGFFSAVNEIMRKRTVGGNSLRPVLVGHNHIGFDLKFIFQRCVILGIKPPHWFPVNPKPWDTDIVFDTMVAWAGRDYVRMDDICESLGIATKGSELEGEADDMDGSKVWDYVRDGRIDLVARYCNGDVERTREMYRRMTFASQDQMARAA